MLRLFSHGTTTSASSVSVPGRPMEVGSPMLDSELRLLARGQCYPHGPFSRLSCAGILFGRRSQDTRSCGLDSGVIASTFGSFFGILSSLRYQLVDTANVVSDLLG